MRPDFRIYADGTDATAIINDRLVELVITDEAGQDSDTCEIIVHDRDFAVELPREGALLGVMLGYRETGLVDMGLYTVDEWTAAFAPEPKVTIHAKAADMLASLKAHKTRSFENRTIGEIVGTIASDHGLDAAVAAEFAGLRVEYDAQTEESDLHYITRLARRFGATAKPAGGKIVFVRRGSATSASGAELPVVRLTWSDFKDGSVTGKGRPRFEAVEAHWHDRGRVERVREKAGSGDQTYTLRHTFSDRDQAMTAAKARKDELARDERSLSGSVPGNPQIVAEADLIITGVRPGVDGLWSVKSVSHRYSGDAGYVTEFEAETKQGR